MLAAFVMIVIGALIIWIVTEPPVEIMLLLWLRMSRRLFQFMVIHSEDDSGGSYAITFTNDEFWQEKMLKDLKTIAEEQVRREDK